MNQIILGDCLIKLKELDDNSVDSIVTDPPYHLVSIVKRFGKEGSAPAQFGTDGAFAGASKGFMGKDWDGLGEDGIGIANNPKMWAECLRVLKPGGHLLSFGGTRTYHRMASAIEDAGFEVRDMIEWVYGSGFPKSLNIAKMIDKMEGVEHPKNTPISDNGSMSGANYTRNKMDVQSDLGKQWEGWGTALKPAHEPICMARKPLAEKTVAENCLKWGTGGINIGESRVGTETMKFQKASSLGNGLNMEGGKAQEDYEGKDKIGRFPANLIHDNSEEVRECFPENVKGEIGRAGRKSGGNYEASSYKVGVVTETGFKDNGSASRFFKSIIYQAKASKGERNKGCEGLEDINVKSWHFKCKKCGKTYSEQSYKSGCHCENPDVEEWTGTSKNNHPTVKPIALMEYLIKMVTPKDGIVLDPFAGSGSTLVAAKQNGFQYIGIEMTEEYIPIIQARLDTITQQTLL